MGENAIRISDGEQVKIGTCENMYYLRADQRSLVRRDRGSLDVNDPFVLKELRFRFPFPDEDHIAPGDFENCDRTIGLHGVAVPAGFKHDMLQFRTDNGYLISLPCPESTGGKAFEQANGREFGRNGWSGAVHVAMQKFVGDKLVTLAKCGGCGCMYRMETIDDAQPVLDALCKNATVIDWREEQSARKDRPFDNTKSGGEFYREIARRIERGYVEGV